MIITTVSTKGWVVIPKEYRERYGLRPGTRVQLHFLLTCAGSADAFAAALARRHNATLMTGDPEFQKVEGLIRVEWLAGRGE